MEKQEDCKPQGERIAIFIDGSNVYHSVKDSFGLHDNEIDFRTLIDFLRKERLMICIFYYNASLDRGYNAEIYNKQQKFFAELRRIPDFHVVLCRLKKMKFPNNKVEYTVKGDDIHLATDLISLAYENRYDTAIIVSGDGDFVPAILKVQKLGKKVENAHFQISSSSYLKSVCNSSVCLDNYISDILRKEKQKN